MDFCSGCICSKYVTWTVNFRVNSRTLGFNILFIFVLINTLFKNLDFNISHFVVLAQLVYCWNFLISNIAVDRLVQCLKFGAPYVHVSCPRATV